MLKQRVLVAAILLPIGLLAIYLGGIAFAMLVALLLGLAGWEYAQLFHSGGYQPSGLLIVAGVLLLLVGRWYDDFQSAPWIITLIVLAGMTYHLVAYERGRSQSATDFAITLSGALYIGWLGAYLLSLRSLPEGFWWVLLVLPAIWIADSSAYFIGRAIGQRKLSPRLSPKKTWEGYLGGVVVGPLGTAILAWLWATISGPGTMITPLDGAILGLVLAVLAPLGDLGESMIKRQFGIKDSGKILPGHGGAFDRIDSWLWAAAIGYYVIVWLLL
jgi:phosphatidate cytidylyltransferase